MVLFIAVVVYCGEGTSVSFGRNLSYVELCDKIRMRFPQLENVSLRLKFTVHPDSTVFQLENDVDMRLLFAMLDRFKSEFVDIDVNALLDASGLNVVPAASRLNVNIVDERDLLEGNVVPAASRLNVNIVDERDLLEGNVVPAASRLNVNIVDERNLLEGNVVPAASRSNANIVDERDLLEGNILPAASGSNVNIEDESDLLEENECLNGANPCISNNSWKYYISHKDQTFEGGVKEFRLKLRLYAIEVGFEYALVTNKANRVIAICSKKESEGCNWCVKASLCRYNGFFVIYHLFNEHTCCSVVRPQKSKMVSSEIVKELILDRVRENPNSKAVQIQKDIKLKFGLDVPYHKAWYGKELAREKILGVEADSYRELRWFEERTCNANPGSRIDVECSTLSESPSKKFRFQRMFVSYSALLDGFQYCRPVLHIDATFIINKYEGMLLAATAKDANCDLYPVAYAIVDSETESNWIYFLKHISECLSRFPERQITFISDRNVGLFNAVRHVFPNSPIGFCYKHLQSDLINKYPSSSYLTTRIPSLFMQCAFSRTREDFEINLQNLKHEGGSVVDMFLKDLPYETWASCYFNGERFGEMANNLAESFNNWVKDLKDLPIVEFNEAIRVKIMTLIAYRKHESVDWVSELCPNLEKKLAANLELGRQWVINKSDTYVYEVQCQKHSVIVNLECLSCSCGEWQVHGFPCSHAVVAVQKHGFDIYSYVNPIFKVGNYRSIYSFTISPVPTISKPVDMCIQSIDMEPPLIKRLAGRPKENRHKSKNEVKRIVKCGRCKRFVGHNRKTCKEVI